MKVTFSETKNVLIDDKDVIHQLYELENGTEIWYKGILIKISGKIGRPKTGMAELYAEMVSLLSLPKKNRRIKTFDNVGLDTELVKNKYAKICLVNGIYGFKLLPKVITEYKRSFRSWVDLNMSRKRCSRTGRITNFPEEISEGLCCLHLKKVLYYKKSLAMSKNKITFDCLDWDNSYQVKGSCSKGPTSFSPKDKYDAVLFFKFDIKSTNYRIYEIGKSDIDKIMVNELESIADQRAKGKRPRTNLDLYIKKMGLQPIYTGTLIDNYVLDENIVNHFEKAIDDKNEKKEAILSKKVLNDICLDVESVSTSEGVFNV